MAPKPSPPQAGPLAKRRKLNSSAPLPEIKPASSSKPKATPTQRKSTISPRRRWRSNAPRAQHPWQKVSRANAETEQGTELERVYALLSLVLRRNRNQHRSQSWWRELTGLRKGVGTLVRLRLEGMDGKVGEDSVAVRERLAREAKQLMQKAELEVFVRETLIPRCYISFSRVVRDPQFAAVGVVLMGILARVGGEVGLPKVQVEVVRGESVRVTGAERERMEVVSREWWAGERGETGGRAGGEKAEKIERSAIVQEKLVTGNTKMEEVEEKIERLMSSSREEKKENKTKKKKPPTKKSTIDDLFADLV